MRLKVNNETQASKIEHVGLQINKLIFCFISQSGILNFEHFIENIKTYHFDD